MQPHSSQVPHRSPDTDAVSGTVPLAALRRSGIVLIVFGLFLAAIGIALMAEAPEARTEARGSSIRDALSRLDLAQPADQRMFSRMPGAIR